MSSNTDSNDLKRFVLAQRDSYEVVIRELSQGRKHSHWMWYIFPQIKGLGESYISQQYAIKNMKEAKAYLEHLILGARLTTCSEMLLNLGCSTASEIFDYPDDLKLASSMSLFASVSAPSSIFHKVLEKYFDGAFDESTTNLLN